MHSGHSTSHLDQPLDREIQSALEMGNSVWVVGDIHGHLLSFQELLEKISLNPGDILVSLGDTIDRGPDSSSVLALFMETDSFHLIRGNHEDMMLRCICKGKNRACKSWLKYGGKQTLDSFGLEPDEMINLSNDICEFLTSTPTQITLKNYLLVHAGINPEKSLDHQTDNDRMWSRNIFDFKEAPFPEKQVIVGHTPTQEIPGHEKSIPYFSELLNNNGKPSIIALDTGICKDRYELPTLTAFDIYTQKIVSVSRVEEY